MERELWGREIGTLRLLERGFLSVSEERQTAKHNIYPHIQLYTYPLATGWARNVNPTWLLKSVFTGPFHFFLIKFG